MAKTKFIVPLGNDTNHPVGRRFNILSELALTKGEYNIFWKLLLWLSYIEVSYTVCQHSELIKQPVHRLDAMQMEFHMYWVPSMCFLANR